MRIFVLYDKSGIHSGRTLGQHLIRKLHGKATVRRGRPKRLELLLSRGERYDYIINVGWFRDFNTGGAKVLNIPSAISNSSNKRKARIKFKSESVPAPQLWLRPDEIPEAKLPVIARTTHHSKGRGLWFCRTKGQARDASSKGATHYLKFVPNVREFRVHVMAPGPELDKHKEEDYRVIKVSEKLPKGSARPDDIVKNHDNGWYFGYPENKKDPVLPIVRRVSKKAIKEFGLHWGAVDIMISRDNGEPYVLEINSTPCLTDDSSNTLEKYANNLCILVGLEKAPVKKKKETPKAPEPKPVKKVKPAARRGGLRSLLTRKRI